MRNALVTAGLLLASVGLTACGGDDAAPKDASASEFCGTYKVLADSLSGADPAQLRKDAAARAAYIKKLKAAVKKLTDIGTPSDISDDARRGFESSVQQIEDLPDEPTVKQLQQPEDVGDDEAKDQAAFGKYLKLKCPEVTGS